MKLTGRGEKIFFSQWISFFLLLQLVYVDINMQYLCEYTTYFF